MGFRGLGILLAAVTASVLASCRTDGKDSHVVASEVVIAESPAQDSVFLYTPGIVEGFDGRLVVSVDYGGPGTSVLDGPRSDFGDYKSGNQIRVLLSDDNGKTWRETSARIPMMHEILFKAGKSLYMIGHSGRLLITRSDDNGETWQISGRASQRGDEAKVVELADGRILMSIRHEGERWYNISDDGGTTWRPETSAWIDLVATACNGDIIRYSSVNEGAEKNILLHSLPCAEGRKNVTVYVSYDEGKTWPVSKCIVPYDAAYSSLCILPDHSIGLYVEESDGDTLGYSMVFYNFALEWLVK